MKQPEQPLQRREGRRLRVGVAVVQPGLDRLGVPVAEVIEDQVVEAVGDLGEREARQASSMSARALEPREDPRSSTSRGRHIGVAPSVAERTSRDTFQSLFASRRPSSIAA